MPPPKIPSTISFTDPVFDFGFHPSNNLVVAGLITGFIHCYQGNELKWATRLSKKSCRGVEFHQDGAVVLTISRDKAIRSVDTASGRILLNIPKAHKYPINRIHALNQHLIATGDDEGVIKLWDMRDRPNITQQCHGHDDFISDFLFVEKTHQLIASGGDGCLSVLDVRKLDKAVRTTDALDDELLCLGSVQDQTQVVAGSQSGALYFFDKDARHLKDKWVGHPSSVDTLCTLDDDTICTGSSDGLVRVVSVSPQHQFEGVLGDHGEDFAVERLRMAKAAPWLGSCGHDMTLRFWDLNDLLNTTMSNQEQLVSACHANYVHAKFDSSDVNLDKVLEKNHTWAKAVTEADPNFFKDMALGQSPKILWIGCSDSRVPANQVLQLGPGEVFVHRNIANVVTHTDMSCLSVLQYAVEVLKIEHIVVCGHYYCGGVATAYSRKQVGLIDNWLRNIKDVYRLNETKVNEATTEEERIRRLVEYNAIHSAQNVCHSTIVQDAWKRNQKLTVHAWVHDISDGMARKLGFEASSPQEVEQIYLSSTD
ncbi:carbonic anhydrase [Gongronella butleri]|nr:carbonic anhydrase [Gongronella butleri]